LVPVSPAEAAVLGVRAGQRWFRLNGVRQVLGSGSPLCLVTVYLHASLAALGRRLPRAARAIYPQVEEALGARIAWVRQRIEAVALDAAQAAQLGAHAGECALRVRRYYHDGNDRLLEVSDSLHPGERFAYEMRLKRDTPGFGASRP
jgi:GntR family transcriptional regulator